MERVKSAGDSPLGQDLQGELLGIDKIQRDIRSIRTWPFDAGAIAKVATIFFSVTAILLSKVLSQYLRI